MLATWPPAHHIYPEPSMVSFIVVITLSSESERNRPELISGQSVKGLHTLYVTCYVSLRNEIVISIQFPIDHVRYMAPSLSGEDCKFFL